MIIIGIPLLLFQSRRESRVIYLFSLVIDFDLDKYNNMQNPRIDASSHPSIVLDHISIGIDVNKSTRKRDNGERDSRQTPNLDNIGKRRISNLVEQLE